jgi:hypothetical protein
MSGRGWVIAVEAAACDLNSKVARKKPLRVSQADQKGAALPGPGSFFLLSVREKDN